MMNRQAQVVFLGMISIVSAAIFVTHTLTKKAEDRWYFEHPTYPTGFEVHVNGSQCFTVPTDGVIEQSGDCSAIVSGDGNKVHTNCGDK